MKNYRYLIVLGLFILLGAGCSTPVLRQDIPVSTNPLGAKIYTDGKLAGTTPGTVSLERNRDHILTLLKDDYRQEDVIIKKKYLSNKVFIKAIQSGVNSGLFFKDARMAIGSGYSSMSNQEATGEAYVLVPSAVTISLTPSSGAPPVNRGAAPAGTADSAATDQDLTAKDVFKAATIAGAAAGATKIEPIEKKWETSSSSKSYVKPDGTMVKEKSSTSVGVGINPAGLLDILDVLFK